MDDFEFAEDGRCVVGEDHLLEVVDDEFVAAVGSEGCLYCAGDCAAGVNVAENGAIFCVVAVSMSVVVS